jgi:ABC-type multidrug transport system fused ATPase/permease subunit
VPQGNTLFSGSIRENLRIGNPEATSEQMFEALHVAQADFVRDLPKGLDTKCGEGGGGLSEGQAQRIAIARAILRPCSILLLDEATSALDVETERKVLMAIREHFVDTTIIFVTHRLSAVQFATDEIHMQSGLTS